MDGGRTCETVVSAYRSHYNGAMPPEMSPPVESFDSLAKLLDVHLLDPRLSSDQVYEACEAAREAGVRAVIVRACDADLVSKWLDGSNVRTGVAVGYPDGTSTTGAKLYEGRDALRLGAQEVEFVINPARMISRQFQAVETELLQISRSCHESGCRLTVVYNSRWLADDLKIIATKICRRVEADAVSVDGGGTEIDLLRPLLKDVLRLKLNADSATLDQALAARAVGYAAIATNSPGPVLQAWRERLAVQQPAETPVS